MQKFKKFIWKRVRPYVIKMSLFTSLVTFLIACSVDVPLSRLWAQLLLISLTGSWIFVVAYANGWIYNTLPYYENRLKRIRKLRKQYADEWELYFED